MLRILTKKIFILTFVMILPVLLSGCKNTPADDLERIIKQDKIIFGVKSDTRPFGFMENGELKGIDIDIARYITKSILGNEKKAEFVTVTTANRLLTLCSGEADMIIASMSVTPQRRMIINFSKPYYMAGQTVLVARDSNIKSITDLKNRRVVVVFGSTAEKNLRLVAPKTIIVGTKDYNKAFEMLRSKQVEGMAADDTILSVFIDNNYKIINKRYTREPYAIGFRKDENSEALMNKVDNILDEMQRNGQLKQIEREWIK